MDTTGKDLWFPEPIRWGIRKGRIAEIMKIVSDAFRPMVDDLMVAMGKIQASKPETTSTASVIPASAPLTKAKVWDRIWWWLRMRTATFLCGCLVGMMVMIVISHSSTTVSLVSPSTQVAAIPTGTVSVPASGLNLPGRGWLVVNRTGENIFVTGDATATIPPGHQRPFSVMKRSNIYLRFTGDDGGSRGELKRTFADNEMRWYEFSVE